MSSNVKPSSTSKFNTVSMIIWMELFHYVNINVTTLYFDVDVGVHVQCKKRLQLSGEHNLFSFLKQRNIIRLILAAVHGDVGLSFILICNMWRDPSLSQFSRETIALCLNSQERHLLPHDGAIHVLFERPLVQLLIVSRILLLRHY